MGPLGMFKFYCCVHMFSIWLHTSRPESRTQDKQTRHMWLSTVDLSPPLSALTDGRRWEALHKDIKTTFARAPAAADSYVSSEVRWTQLEKLFQNPKVPLSDLFGNSRMKSGSGSVRIIMCFLVSLFTGVTGQVRALRLRTVLVQVQANRSDSH